ncbi:hypothetical protein J2T13_001562 [Paenibacillus sp. DS2015]|uniref:hypothetical protein n=1 Tax=Paenibacillus sp. DS2015 TaxID=3373917 RepID=UPI003D244953
MSFCIQCGQSLEEGTSHQCAANNAIPMVSSAGKPQSVKVDLHVLLGILKNPMNALKLNASEGGLVYGLIGLGVSLIGFLLYALALKQVMINMISSVFGELSGFFDGAGSIGNSFSGGIASQLSLGWNALWIGLVSAVALLATYWLVGNAVSKKKMAQLDFITKVGAFQLVFGVVFILSALLAFITFKFSILLMVISLLLALVCTNTIVSQIYGVQGSQQLKLSAIAVSIYALIILLLLQVVV